LKKKVDFKGKIEQSLTNAEQEVLTLLTQEFLTPKKIATRRRCTKQAISKIIKKLRKKGLINQFSEEVDKSRPTCQPLNSYGYQNIPSFPVEHQIRLHGQEFNIKILYKDQRYKKILEKSNTINIDGNTIRLYRNSIEIYSGQSFYADDPQKATAISFQYWNRLFAKLENDLKLILIKPRAQNIKLVNQHYSEINNELAEECEKKAEKVRVYTTDDGKLWFLIDNSFNLHEAETTHPQTSKQDMGDVIKPFFNDLRDNNPPIPSIIWQITAENTKAIQSYAAIPEKYNNSINALNRQIQLHLRVMHDIKNGINEFRKSIDQFTIRPKEDIISFLFNNPSELAKFKAMNKEQQNKILFGDDYVD